MATYFINSSRESVVGTTGDDQFLIESGIQRTTLQGNDGNDSFDFFFGAVNSSYNYGNSITNGNVGDDTIRIKINSGSDILANFFGGGQGNDQILVTANSGSNSASFVGNVLQGGEGNDTIKIEASALQVSNLTINGNAGVDFISFSASSFQGGRLRDLFIAGGADNDQVNFDINNSGSEKYTINGGAGADRLRIEFADTATDLIVNGGTNGTDAAPDGDDDIFVSAENFRGRNSIIGNNGNDNIYVVSDSAANLLMAGNGGDDTITISANDLRNVTLGGGAGDDLIVVQNSAGIFSAGANSLIGGNGDDTINIKSGNSLSGASVTIQGGAGADLFFAGSADYAASGFSAANLVSAATFSYASLTDSTIDTLDTIVVGSGSLTGGEFTFVLPQAVDAFDGEAGGYFFTAGILAMDTGAGSGGDISLSQIVGTLDATLAEGEAVAFRLDTADQFGFVFVAGAQAGVDDDLLVRLEGFSADQLSAGDARLRNAGSNDRLLLELD